MKTSTFHKNHSGTLLSPITIANHFKDHIQRCGVAGDSLLAHCEKHLFFVTAMFRPASVWLINKDSPTSYPTAMAEFSKCMFRINKRLLGCYLQEQAERQLFGYAFLDFNGTRHGNGVDQDNVHIHALMLAHPTTMQEFDVVYRYSHAFKGPTMQQLHMSVFDRNKGSFLNLISYASKGYRKSTDVEREQYWDMFPKIIERKPEWKRPDGRSRRK